MNRILLFFVLIAIVACEENGRKAENPITLEFEFSYDTVTINSGEHLFNLGHGIPKVKLSQDEQYLYFFDDYNLALDKIDLEKKEFVLTIPFEKEGPKGIGATFDYIPDENGNIQLLTPKRLFSIDEKGVLNSNFPSYHSIFEMGFESRFFEGARISPDSQFLFGLTTSTNGNQSLAWVNLKDTVFHVSPLDSMAYRKSLEIDLGRLTISGMQEAEYFEHHILVYHDDGIDFYALDLNSKSLEFHDFEPTKVPKRKDGKYPKSGSTADLTKILEMEGLEINYSRIVYDSSYKRYYRIASKKRENQVRAGIPNQFLLVFSDDFKLIHEEDLSNLPFSITTYFVREGKFWVFNKETEELEFFVFDFNFN
ncbi:hypothetical protein FHS59_002065 [Algoriphagus iocasae]|uniref:DUF4221 domain-containing protein n=1 Tax=Algoriphagus iocasae TaxID=1836499 RepID=A0A841MLR5_9BACT|nr:DUF4221 family protein [Algoriphagus iocasae]MBB6326437.1 hypothetical protein [Algoriphagus iocasae]